MPTLTPDELRGLVETTLLAAGLTGEEADICADVALFADLRGTDTHGVMYIVPRTLGSVREGNTVPGAQMEIVRDSGAAALVKGNGLAGPVLGRRAMELAIDRAEQHGVGVVNTYNGNPLGCLGYFPSLAAARGKFGLTMANTAPSVAPHGSRSRVFGTNPFAYAAPAGKEDPIIFDAASSIAAAGKLQQARRRDESLPPDWVIDAEGQPITDPRRANEGASVAFGGHKGSAIALLVHILTGGLAGTTVGGEDTHNHQDSALRGQSALFLALDPAFFGGDERFRSLMDRQVQNVRAAEPLPGLERVRLPGERGFAEAERRRRDGIPIPDADWESLRTAIRDAGLAEAELLGHLARDAAASGR
jgi:LDH2 family malate/lactate/ureidoglycolate dehydrogenase